MTNYDENATEVKHDIEDVAEQDAPILSAIAEAALEYHKHGLSPIPIKPRGKEPDCASWPTYHFSLDRAATDFPKDRNIGVKLGAISSNLCDIDLDWPEARIMADALEERGIITKAPTFGRKGSPKSHRLIRITDKTKTKQFKLPAREERAEELGLKGEHATIPAELRGDGAYTVFPPSTHKTDEAVAWTEGDTKANLEKVPEIDYQTAVREVGLIAFCAVMLRFYPAEGSRNDFCMALGGALIRAGYDQPEDDYSYSKVHDIIEAIAEAANDEEYLSRARCAKYTINKFYADKEVTGLPKACEIAGISDLTKTLKEWLPKVKSPQELRIDELARMDKRAYQLSPVRRQFAGELELDVKELDALVTRARDEVKAEEDPEHWKSEEDAVDFMNKRHALIKNIGNKTRYVAYIDDPEYKDRKLICYQTETDLRQQYANRKVVGLPRETFFTVWKQSKERRDFDTVKFDPSREGHSDTQFNTWQGFAIKPDETKPWTLFEQHLREVVCRGDEQRYEYLLNYIAWTLQNPGKPAERVFILRGEQGTGKTLVWNVIRRIFGRHGMTIYSKKHLTGNFNAHLQDCAFLLSEEAFHAEDKGVNSALKAIITGERIPIERKGVDTVEVENILTIVMTSNEERVVEAGYDTRRYVDYRVANTYGEINGDSEDIQNHKRKRASYFKKLHEELQNGGEAGFLASMLKRQLFDFHPRNPLPFKDDLQEQIKEGWNSIMLYVFDILSEGYIQYSRRRAPNTLILKSTVEFCLAEKVKQNRENLTDSGIRRQLRRILLKLGCTSRESNGDTVYTFPPLQEARRKFDEVFGPENWDNEIREWGESPRLHEEV